MEGKRYGMGYVYSMRSGEMITKYEFTEGTSPSFITLFLPEPREYRLLQRKWTYLFYSYLRDEVFPIHLETG